MTGYTASFQGSDNDTWLIKSDSIGNVVWHRTYNHLSPNEGDGGLRVLVLADGNFIIIGGSNNSSTGNSDGFMLKVDPNGNEIWTKKYVATSGSQGLYAGAELNDGSIVSCGQTTNTSDESQAGWLIKTNANGDTLWTRTYSPSPLIDRLLNMLVMPNGDIIMVGSGRDTGQINQDGWILRVDSMGCVEENCFSVGIEEIEKEDRFFRAGPNPFSQSTTIAYDLGKDCESGCELRLYDLQGRVILSQTLFTDEGKGSITVDMSNYRSGIYYCSLYGDKQLLQTEKLILMK